VTTYTGWTLDLDGRGAIGAVVDDTEGDLGHDFYWYGKLVADDATGLALSNPSADDYGHGELQVYVPDGSWDYPALTSARISVDFVIDVPTETPTVPRFLDLLGLNTNEQGTTRKAQIKATGSTPRLEWVNKSSVLLNTVPLVLDRWYRLIVDWDNGNIIVTVSHGSTIDATFTDSPGGTFQAWFRSYAGIVYDGAGSKVRVTIDRLFLGWPVPLTHDPPYLRNVQRGDGLGFSSAPRFLQNSTQQASLRNFGTF
jgi:hypothetical protein